MKPPLLKHISGESIGRFPVWMMRQAGRYLPSYREIRKKHTFWEMVTQPEVAAAVSLLPANELPVDGIIFFSDILTLPYGMGIPIEMQESVGPVATEPLRTLKAFEAFKDFDADRDTGFVGDALKIVREKMADDKTLLGFAGAPWTVGCYLVEGKASRHFQQMITWMHRDPAELAKALGYLGDATVKYLLHQHRAGAQVVQLFDTWLAEMPRDFFIEHYRPVLNRIFGKLREAKVPTIYFNKHAHHLLEEFRSLDVDMLSVDNLLPLTEIEKRTGGKFGLQGNLDPLLLFCDPGLVRKQTRLLVAEARKLTKPAILNLGHGVLPGASVDCVRAFLEEARELWV